jgi:hypothetical protein
MWIICLVVIRFRLYILAEYYIKWCYIFLCAAYQQGMICPFIGDVNLGYLVMVVSIRLICKVMILLIASK